MIGKTPERLSRRDFLNFTGGVVGGLAVGPVARALGVKLSGQEQTPAQGLKAPPEIKKPEIIAERSDGLRNKKLAEFITYDHVVNDLRSVWGLDLFPDVTNATNQAANSTTEFDKEITLADGWREVVDKNMMFQRSRDIADTIPITGQGNHDGVRTFLGKVADNYPALLIASEGYDVHLDPEHRAPGEVDMVDKKLILDGFLEANQPGAYEDSRTLIHELYHMVGYIILNDEVVNKLKPYITKRDFAEYVTTFVNAQSEILKGKSKMTADQVVLQMRRFHGFIPGNKKPDELSEINHRFSQALDTDLDSLQQSLVENVGEVSDKDIYHALSHTLIKRVYEESQEEQTQLSDDRLNEFKQMVFFDHAHLLTYPAEYFKGMEMVGFDNQYDFISLQCALVESNRLRLISGSTEVPNFRDLHQKIHGYEIHEAIQPNYWESIDPLVDAGVKHLGTINLRSRFGGSSTNEVRAYELPETIGMEGNRLIYLETREINNAAPPKTIKSYSTSKLLVIPKSLTGKPTDFTEVEGTVLNFADGIVLTAKEKSNERNDKDDVKYTFSSGTKEVDYYYHGELLETMDIGFLKLRAGTKSFHLNNLEYRLHYVDRNGSERLEEVPSLTYIIDEYSNSVPLGDIPISASPAGEVVVGEFGNLRLVKGLTEKPFAIISRASRLEEEDVIADITVDEEENTLKVSIGGDSSDETNNKVAVVFKDLPAEKLQRINSLIKSFPGDYSAIIEYDEHELIRPAGSDDKYGGIPVIKPVYKLSLRTGNIDMDERLLVIFNMGEGEILIE